MNKVWYWWFEVVSIMLISMGVVLTEESGFTKKTLLGFAFFFTGALFIYLKHHMRSSHINQGEENEN